MYYGKEKEKERISEIPDIIRPSKVKTPPISFKSSSDRLDWTEVGKRIRRQSEDSYSVMQNKWDDRVPNVAMDVDRITSTHSSMQEEAIPDEDSQHEREKDFAPVCIELFRICQDSIDIPRNEIRLARDYLEKAKEEYGLTSEQYEAARKRYIYANHKYEKASEQFKEWMIEFERAIRHLEQSPTARELLNIVTQSREILDEEITVTIRFNNKHLTQFIPGTKEDRNSLTIDWDPTSGLILNRQSNPDDWELVNDGSRNPRPRPLGGTAVNSPAMGLAHELGHVAQKIMGNIKYEEGTNRLIGTDENGRPLDGIIAVEDHNLKRWEIPIAEELGEHARYNYFDHYRGGGMFRRMERSDEWGYILGNTLSGDPDEVIERDERGFLPGSPLHIDAEFIEGYRGSREVHDFRAWMDTH
ncbi:MAG: M91 family zinc metallopeptidase [Defluviitaleaceae bacterium]|nr:M91 family zinc metallopeptidase [Defluviitaleaceae bacterium]